MDRKQLWWKGLMCCRPAPWAEVVQFLRGEAAIPPKQVDLQQLFSLKDEHGEDFCEVRGQDHAKRAIEWLLLDRTTSL
jgi:Predicted ATPase with chaperone activity